MELFIFVAEELDFHGNVCQILIKYFEFLNKYEKLYAKPVDSKYDCYRDIDQKEKNYYVNKNLTCYQFLNSCQN